MVAPVCDNIISRQEAKADLELNMVAAMKKFLVPDSLSKEVAKEILKSTVGGVIGSNLNDAYLGEDAPPILTFLGAGLGSKRIRSFSVNRYKKFTKGDTYGKLRPHLPKWLHSSAELDDVVRENFDMAVLAGIDPKNVAGVGALRQAYTVASAAKESGKSFADSILNSRYVRSIFSTLTDLKLPLGIKLRNLWQTQETFTKEIANRFRTSVGEITYNGKTYTYDTLFDGGGFAGLAREIMPAYFKNMSDVEASMITQDAIMRILYAGGRLDDAGKYVYDLVRRDNIKDVYDKNPSLQTTDEQFLKHPVIAKFVESEKAAYKSVQNEYINLVHEVLGKKKAQYAMAVNDADGRIINAFTNFQLSGRSMSKELAYLKEIGNTADLDNLRALADDVRGAEMIELQNSIAKFETYKNGYFPQFWAKEKELVLWERFKANPNKFTNQFKVDVPEGITEAKLRDFFDEYIARRIAEVNGKDFKVIQDIDEDGIVKNLEFKTMDEARAWLFADKQVQRMGREEYDLVASNPDRLIKEIRDGKKTRYVIQKDDTTTFEFLEKAQADVFKKVYQGHIAGMSYPKSSHLDYDRKVLLPVELIESDMRKVANRYTYDVSPRLFNMKNGMFNENDFIVNYGRPIYDGLIAKGVRPEDAKESMDRLINIYNVINVEQRFNTPQERLDYVRNQKMLNTYRAVASSRGMYGWSYYNMLEWAMVSPLISSWRATGSTLKHFISRDVANTWTDAMGELGIIDKHYQTFQPQTLHNGDNLSASARVDLLDNVGRTVADKVGNFSFTKSLGRMIGFDVEKQGLFRLIGDSFVGSNIMGTTITVRSALFEARKLGDIGRQLKVATTATDPNPTIVINGTRWTKKKVQNALTRYNVVADYESFIENFDALDGFIKNLDAGEKLDSRTFTGMATELNPTEAEKMKTAYRHIRGVMDAAFDQQHGVNKVHRPEFSNEPLGRIFYQFGTYQFNLAFQNIQRKIRLPIQEWKDTYVKDGQKLPIMRAYLAYKDLDDKSLTKLGLSKEAIDNFPVESMEHILKYFAAVVGIGGLSNMTVDVITDFLALPFGDDSEDWRRSLRTLNLEPLAPNGRTWMDVMDDPELGDAAKISLWLFGQGVSSGGLGTKGSDLLYKEYRGTGSILDMVPAGRDIQDLVEVASQTTEAFYKDGFAKAGETLTRNGTKMFVKNIPFINSNVFNGGRQALIKRLDKDKKVRYRNTETGELFNINDYTTNFDFGNFNYE